MGKYLNRPAIYSGRDFTLERYLWLWRFINFTQYDWWFRHHNVPQTFCRHLFLSEWLIVAFNFYYCVYFFSKCVFVWTPCYYGWVWANLPICNHQDLGWLKSRQRHDFLNTVWKLYKYKQRNERFLQYFSTQFCKKISCPDSQGSTRLPPFSPTLIQYFYCSQLLGWRVRFRWQYFLSSLRFNNETKITRW